MTTVYKGMMLLRACENIANAMNDIIGRKLAKSKARATMTIYTKTDVDIDRDRDITD